MEQSRLDQLREVLEATNFSGLALNAGPSLSYFSGLNFHQMERPVVLLFVPDRKPALIMPRLEAAKVSSDEEKYRLFLYDEDPSVWPAVFTDAMQYAEMEGKTIGVEPLSLRFFEYKLLQKVSASTIFTDGGEVISHLRSKKDEHEIGLMKKAVIIAEEAIRQVIPRISVGMEERELAGELVVQLLRLGSEPHLPFSPIVSSGPNGANPHAKPSQRRLQEGDLLVIDWGASYEGYVSDLTRTFAIGEIDEESQLIHDLVFKANKAGREAGQIGKPCQVVDRAARKIIADGGYGSYFTHRTGHGIGKECHEEPYMREDNVKLLEEGMTYTVEPGIYLPGRNGVRIEDDVLITKEGPVSLSTLPRELIQVG